MGNELYMQARSVIMELAEKAKFSQHELTGKELAMIGQWQALYEAQLREQSFLRRVINCLVFAVY